MKICYLADVNSAHTKKWCSYFKEQGYDIHVISLSQGTIEGVKVHSMSIDMEDIKRDSSFSKINYIFQLRKVKSLIREISPDILHAHYASSYGFIGALMGYHPYILSLWGSDVYDFPQKGFLFRKILEYNLKKSDLLMSTSHAMARETGKYTNKPIEITPFGIDTEVFRPIEAEADEKKSFTIGIVKSLEKVYGIDDLIKAFAILKNKYPDIKLEIAGAGSQKENLTNLCSELGVSDKVDFLGVLNIDEVVKAFNRFDAAVFPSLRESFGVAALEAQACGTPVVVSRAEGLVEVTRENETSIIVNIKSPEEIAEAVSKLIDDENLRSTMSINCRKHVVENYNLKDNFEKVNKIYQQIIAVNS